MSRVLVGVFLATMMADASACSCGRQSEEKWFAESSHVFSARVTGTEADSGENIRATFAVIEVFKGDVAGLRHIMGFKVHGANCALELERGGTYLFRLSGSQSRVSACNSVQLGDTARSARVLEANRKLKGGR